jgi:outer membrane receptor for ferrienterochelin and colicins
MRTYLLLSISLIAGMKGWAQKDTAAPKTMAEVVVTGQYQPQSLKKSVYQVRTISKDRIVQQGATRLQDVLNNELNIRFNQDLATGGSDITMMGLKGQNVKILLDGLPLTGRQGASNEININQIDINTIERVEIVEGPMSVIYGADALAGVINIITKKAATVKWNIQAKAHEETVGREYGVQEGIHNQNISGSIRLKNWEIGGGLTHNRFNGWKDSAIDRELVWHKKDQWLTNGYIAYHKNKLSVRYRLDGLDEVITNPGNFLFPQQLSGDTLAYDQEYLSQRLMHQFQGNYQHNNHLNFQLQSTYSDYSRQVFSTTVSKKNGDVRLDLADGAQSVINFKGLTARGIANYRVSSKLAFQPGIDFNMDKGEGERLKTGTNSIEDLAFFLTSEYTPTEKISIRPGIRIINNSVYKAPPVIPSINAKFALTNNFDLRIAYAQGFRAPSLRELYFNFFDANHQILGNTNLKAETSNSLNLSVAYKNASTTYTQYSVTASGFYNHIKNLIDYGVSDIDPNIFTMLNIADSKTAGFNVSSTARIHNWNLAAGFSYTGFYNDYVAQDDNLPTMQFSPEINFNAGYRFPKAGLDINFFYKHTGKRPYYIQKDQTFVLSQIKGYDMADITVNKKINQYFTLQGGVRNLFDIDRVASTSSTLGVHTDNGNRNIATGRSFFAGLQFNLSSK